MVPFLHIFVLLGSRHGSELQGSRPLIQAACRLRGTDDSEDSARPPPSLHPSSSEDSMHTYRERPPGACAQDLHRMAPGCIQILTCQSTSAIAGFLFREVLLFATPFAMHKVFISLGVCP